MKNILILLILLCFIMPCSAGEGKQSTDLINVTNNNYPTDCFVNNDKYHDYVFYSRHEHEFIGIIKYNEKIFLFFEDEYIVYVTPSKELTLTTKDIENKIYINWFTYLIILIGIIIIIKLITVVIRK